MSDPRQRHWKALVRIARYLKGVPRAVYQFRSSAQPWQKGCQIYSDTDFAGCRTTRKSTSGGCALINGHLIKTWSSTQKVIALSSGEAELAGIVKAASEGLGLRSLHVDLGLQIDFELHADSSAAIGMAERVGVG